MFNSWVYILAAAMIGELVVIAVCSIFVGIKALKDRIERKMKMKCPYCGCVNRGYKDTYKHRRKAGYCPSCGQDLWSDK